MTRQRIARLFSEAGECSSRLTLPLAMLRTLIGVLIAFSAVSVHAAATQMARLTDLSLEQLGDIEVTSVSRHAERLADAAASIFVISAEDIRRSGARTLPEALRLAPNLQVAQTNAGSYAVSARGFNNAIGNKLLVLIDGRTVYTPLFSGVFWDSQSVMLEDIERIEVISGPGATLWGANAVNGVINVISRTARNTQGTLVSAGVGNRDRGAAVRYGAKLGDDGYFRIYGKAFDLQNTKAENGISRPDGLQRSQVGFRADWGLERRNFTVQGDAYDGESEERLPGGPVKVSGVNLLARWNEQMDSGSNFRLQAYFDRSERQDMTGFQGNADTFDVEFQHGIPLGRHKVLWGGGYRHSRDEIPDTLPPLAFVFVPQSRSLSWENIFVQDAIKLGSTVELTLGLKMESNDYTGREYLPSARLAWKPSDNQLVWGAASRAVRAPARLDRDFSLRFIFPPLNLPVIKGGPYFESEIAKVLELGYRQQLTPSLSYSVTAFHNIYKKLRSGQPPPAFIENQIEGVSNGIEAWGSYQATRAWRLSGGFTTLHQHFGARPGSRDPTGSSALGNDPDQQWMLRSTLNLTDQHEFDVMMRRVGSLPLPAVPAYTAVDARLGWRLNHSTELSLTLQNLFDSAHPEFEAAGLRSEYGRSIFLKMIWRM